MIALLKRIVWSNRFNDLRRAILIVLMFLTVGGFMAYGQFLTDQITILGATPVPNSQKPTDKVFETMSDCGFNSAFYYSSSVKELKEVSCMASKSGISLMPNNPLLRSNDCVGFINNFTDDHNIIGWDFVDEPKYKDLVKLKGYYDELRLAQPSRIVLLNLIGVKNTVYTGGQDLKTYLSEIHQMFKPQVWCYDLYPIYEEDGRVKVWYDSFYSSMEIFSAISRKSGVPFWTYCQSMEMTTKGVSYKRPATTVAYLRFANFTALAYGCQGILYWTYGQRESNDREHYISALVNMDGSKTKAWYAAQQVNHEIKALNDVFYQSRVIDCRHIGDSHYRETKKLTGNFGPIRHITAGSSGVIVSHLCAQGNDYIIVVSRDPLKPQTVRISFEDDYNQVELTPVVQGGAYHVERKAVRGMVKRKLPAGGYLVFQYGG